MRTRRRVTRATRATYKVRQIGVWDDWDDRIFKTRRVRAFRHVAMSLLTLAILTPLMSGCGSSSTAATAAESDIGNPQRGGSIVVGMAKEPPIINPWLAPGAMSVTTMMTDGTNDPLVILDDSGKWEPVLIKEVPSLENGGVTLTDAAMDIRFEIKSEAKWEDGVPVSCDDVKFTWKTVTDTRVQMNNRFGWEHIDSIECQTQKSVLIHMDSRYALYMSRIMAMPPLPAHELRGKDFNSYWNDRITLSNGPYRMVSWQRGVKIVLVRNKNYWNAGPNKRPYLDKITFRFVKDANTLKVQLRMLETDLAMLPADTNLVMELKMTPDIHFDIRPGPVMEHLIFQTSRPPLDNRYARLALVHAIDREMITKVVLKSQVDPLQQSFVPSLGYNFTHFDTYTPSSKKVSMYMKKAGYTKSGGWWRKSGKIITIHYTAGAGSMPFRARVAQLVQQQLQREGIKMEIAMVPSEVLYSQLAPKGEFDMGEWSELTGVEPLASILFACDQIPRKPLWAGKNRYRYCNKKLDKLMHAADLIADPNVRREKLGEIDAIVASDVPMVPLFQSPDANAWSTKLHGIIPNPFMGVTWNMDEWWVTQ